MIIGVQCVQFIVRFFPASVERWYWYWLLPYTQSLSYRLPSPCSSWHTTSSSSTSGTRGGRGCCWRRQQHVRDKTQDSHLHPHILTQLLCHFTWCGYSLLFYPSPLSIPCIFLLYNLFLVFSFANLFPFVFIERILLLYICFQRYWVIPSLTLPFFLDFLYMSYFLALVWVVWLDVIA